MEKISKGRMFREAVKSTRPLQVVGVINAYCALMATQVGFSALYLSGAGVANAAYGLPDLGLTSLSDVVNEASKITAVTQLPLLVDIDTGWGSALNIARTIQSLSRVDVAGVHIEDQVAEKRCGHRPSKQIVSQQEMVDRIKAAVDARLDPDFVIMARTDAFASEGLSQAIDRLSAYIEAGADMIFPEAVTELNHYQQLASKISVPILANMTEFGKTPLFTRDELSAHGVGLILYPLSAFRAMNAAALSVYQTIISEGSQASCLSAMQTRETLYEFLNYYAYEAKIDELYGKNKEGA